MRVMRGKVCSMSMLDSKGEVRPVVQNARSGLHADGPDWDAGVVNDEPSMTKQSFADECDINFIMARYEKTGVLPEGKYASLEFGDAISEYSYQESLNAVIAAREYFSELPAKVRERFGNDPQHLFAFLDDEKNRDEAVELGLVNAPKPKAEPLEVRVVDPPQQDPPKGGSGGPGGAPA